MNVKKMPYAEFCDILDNSIVKNFEPKEEFWKSVCDNILFIDINMTKDDLVYYASSHIKLLVLLREEKHPNERRRPDVYYDTAEKFVAQYYDERMSGCLGMLRDWYDGEIQQISSLYETDDCSIFLIKTEESLDVVRVFKVGDKWNISVYSQHLINGDNIPLYTIKRLIKETSNLIPKDEE